MPSSRIVASDVKHFTPQELEWLVKGVQQYGTNYVQILEAFPFTNRNRQDLRLLYRRLARFCRTIDMEPTDIKVLDVFPLTGHQLRWTDEQAEALCEAVKKHGTHWALISKLYRTGPLSGFTASQLDQKWWKLVSSLKQNSEQYRQFRLLDVADEFGNSYVFVAKSLYDCARQAKNLKYELMRFKDLTTGHIHCFMASDWQVIKINVEKAEKHYDF